MLQETRLKVLSPAAERLELTGATLAHSLSPFIKRTIRLTMHALTLLNPGWLSD